MNRKESIIETLEKIEKLTKDFKNDVKNNETTNDIEVLEQLWSIKESLYNTLVKNLSI